MGRLFTGLSCFFFLSCTLSDLLALGVEGDIFFFFCLQVMGLVVYEQRWCQWVMRTVSITPRNPNDMLQTPRLALVTCIKAAVAGDLFVSGPSSLALRLGRSGQQLLPRAQHKPSMGAFRVRRHPGALRIPVQVACLDSRASSVTDRDLCGRSAIAAETLATHLRNGGRPTFRILKICRRRPVQGPQDRAARERRVR